MFIDMKNRDAQMLLLALNGEIVGYVVEADTDEGYIDRYEWSPEKMAFTGQTIRRKGRVDVIGNVEKDPPEVLHERLNKIREELKMPPLPNPPFLHG